MQLAPAGPFIGAFRRLTAAGLKSGGLTFKAAGSCGAEARLLPSCPITIQIPMVNHRGHTFHTRMEWIHSAEAPHSGRSSIARLTVATRGTATHLMPRMILTQWWSRSVRQTILDPRV